MKVLSSILVHVPAFFCALCFEPIQATEASVSDDVAANNFVVNQIVNDQFVAEILNMDLENAGDEDFLFVETQLLRYKVVVVRNQPQLTVEGQRRFSQRFGSLHVHLESASHHQGYNDVNLVSNIKNENGAYIGLYGAHVENFHTDLSW
jgi:alpha-ketoglutarate-dependent taurine dioxygenase